MKITNKETHLIRIFSDEQRRDMLRNALGLYERIAFSSQENQTETANIDQEFAYWKVVTGMENEAGFQLRLRSLGLDESQAKTEFGKQLPEVPAQVADWTEPLSHLVTKSLEKAGSAEVLFDIQVTYYHLYNMMAQVLLQETLDAVPDIRPYLTDTVLSCIKTDGILRLHEVLDDLISLEFKAYRSSFRSSLFGVFASEEGMGDLRRQFYEYFITPAALSRFFRENAVVARRLVVLTRTWKANLAAFFERFLSDKTELEAEFNDGKPIGKIIKLRCDASDRHNGGKQVVLLQVDSERKIVYKPKHLGMAAAFGEFVGWVNSVSPEHQLRAVSVLKKEDYGWVEFVQFREIEDPALASDFYFNCGFLLSLLHVFEASDCHYENVIVSGCDPVLIDLETLFHNYSPSEKRRGPRKNVGIESLSESVIRTGFLPSWVVRGGQSYDVSALGNTEKQEIDMDQGRIVIDETGNVKHEAIKSTITPTLNVLRCKGEVITCDDYMQEIKDGFSHGFQLLRNHAAELQSEGSVLQAFRGQNSRLVFRPTQLYMDLLLENNRSQYSRNGLLAAFHLDTLSFAHEKATVHFHELKKREYEDLLNYDVPFLYGKTDCTGLFHRGDEIAPDFFAEASFDRVQQRIGTLTADDLQMQLMFIEASVVGRQIFKAHDLPEDEENERIFADLSRKAEPGQFLAESETIAKSIMDSASNSEEYGTTWLALQFNNEVSKMQYHPIGQMVYNGSLGIAVYMAALYRVTGKKHYRKAANGIVRPVLRAVEQEEFTYTEQLNTGGLAGLGSIIYSFALLDELMDRPDLTNKAIHLLHQLTDERIREDNVFDIVFGSAGFVLALNRLRKVREDEIVLHKLRVAAQHLFDSAQYYPKTGVRTWATLDEGNPITGFSHGVAGICYALDQVRDLLPGEDVDVLISENLGFEDSLLFEDYSNWKSYEDKPTNLFAWCHGGTGIGLSRIRMGVQVAGRHDPAELAIEQFMRYGLDQVDHVCCGNFGRIELLMQCYLRDGQEKNLQNARSIALQLMARAADTGGYNMQRNIPKSLNPPGFFQGMAGIGYQLLRLHAPRQLPSLMVLE